MKKINVAIIGVGNCASSLVQGVEYYKELEFQGKIKDDVIGLIDNKIGKYKISDINFTAAFDINETKVGKDLSEAIYADPNCTFEVVRKEDMPKSGVKVERGMTLDGLGKYLKTVIKKAPGQTADIVEILKETKTDMVINYLPVGSENATKFYTEKILEAGCGMINCIPVFIASDNGYWQDRFKKKNLPIIGDDIKSQVGATIVHRVLTDLFEKRGVKLLQTSQLNVGGNTDFLNMLERERLVSKKLSKTEAVQSQLRTRLDDRNIHVGPSDHIKFLDDRKWCYIYMNGINFGGAPLKLELKLEVWDSPNSAAVVIDAIRYCKIALDRKIGGPLIEPSAYLMKHPPKQFTDDEARTLLKKFVGDEKE